MEGFCCEAFSINEPCQKCCLKGLNFFFVALKGFFLQSFFWLSCGVEGVIFLWSSIVAFDTLKALPFAKHSKFFFVVSIEAWNHYMAIFPFYYCYIFFVHLIFLIFKFFPMLLILLLLVALQVLVIYNYSPFFNTLLWIFTFAWWFVCLFSMLQLMMMEFIVTKPFVQTSK